jgi:hypothetical protein
MATKNRSDLKSYFVKNAIPTEGNFADLIDSQLNQTQDGVFKPDGDALSVVAASGDQKRVLRLFASYPATNPDWMISLNPAQDPAKAATTSKSGFGITDSAGKTRLFIDATTGQIGVGTNTPQFALDVVGRIGIGTQAPNDVPNDKIILYENGATSRYGIGLNNSNINLFCPTDGRFSLRQNSASGTEVYKIDANGNSWTQGKMTFQASGGTNSVSMYYEGSSAGHFVIYNPSGNGVYLIFGQGWATYSDVALKTDVVTHEPVLDRVMKLRPVQFTWKADSSDGSGFIAQEVETLFPDLVSEGSVDDATGRCMKGISYERFGVLAIAAIKELKTDHDARFDALERKLAAREGKS